MQSVNRRWVVTVGAVLLSGCSSNPLSDLGGQTSSTTASGGSAGTTRSQGTQSDAKTSRPSDTEESGGETTTPRDDGSRAGIADRARSLLPPVDVLPSGYSHQSTTQGSDTGVASFVRTYRDDGQDGGETPASVAVSVTGFDARTAAAEATETRIAETESRYDTSMETVNLESGVSYQRLRTVTDGEYLTIHLCTVGQFSIAVVASDSLSYGQSVPLRLTQTVFERHRANIA